MKRLYPTLLLAVLCLLTIPGFASSERSSDKSLLWRISGAGLNRPSYLFGTIHLLCPEDYLWTDSMRQSLANCRKVCFEMDMDDPSLLMEAAAGMMDTSGKSLRDYFTDAQYRRLVQFVQDSIGIDISGLPMIGPVMLQTLFLTKAINCAFPISYEAKIMEAAHKSGKEIVGLETAAEQLSLLTGGSDDSTAAAVMQMVDSFSASRRTFRMMVERYREQDLPALYQLIRSSDELGENMGPLLDDRNRRWIPRMEAHMKSGPVFFAVGAAHLYGDAGVISLLRKAGYTLTPVR